MSHKHHGFSIRYQLCCHWIKLKKRKHLRSAELATLDLFTSGKTSGKSLKWQRRKISRRIKKNLKKKTLKAKVSKPRKLPPNKEIEEEKSRYAPLCFCRNKSSASGTCVKLNSSHIQLTHSFQLYGIYSRIDGRAQLFILTKPRLSKSSIVISAN